MKSGKKQYVNGAYFSLKKTHIVKKYSNDKSPVKIGKYSIGNLYESTRLVMNNKTFSKDAPKSNIELDPGKGKEIISFWSLNKISVEELIFVKAKIINISGIKVVPLANETLRKLEIKFFIPHEHQNFFVGGEL